MAYSTLQQTQQQPITAQAVGSQAAQEARRPSLVAQWHVIDGRLVCRWNLV